MSEHSQTPRTPSPELRGMKPSEAKRSVISISTALSGKMPYIAHVFKNNHLSITTGDRVRQPPPLSTATYVVHAPSKWHYIITVHLFKPTTSPL